MNFSIVFLTFLLSVISSCYSWSIPPVEYSENNLNLPHSRQVRQVLDGGIRASDQGGIRGTVGASQTLLNQNGHRLDGHGQISKNWKPNGPTEIGAGLNYQGPRGGASVDANHARHFGTNLNAEGNVNLWRSPNGRSQLDGAANYNQHFGGPGGRSRPNYGGGLNFSHRF
ncbi:hypothetical protein HA402_002961 [Bradysia odoriphaga]|nr:hypothetical protein HA402_002961 [Bradysia odoriphaga]